MKMLLMYSRIGLRNIRRNVRRSLFTIVAVSFGLFCLIVFEALKVGLHHEMLHSTLNLDAAAIQVHAAGFEQNLALLQPLPQPAEVETQLAAAGITHFTARIKSPALVLAGKRSSSVLLAGVIPEQEKEVTFIADKITAGTYLTEPGTILIGQALADSLRVGLGDEVTLMVQSMFGRPAARKFTIDGMFRTELASFDRNHLYLDLTTAQHFLDADGAITEIAIRTPPEKAAAAAEILQGKLGDAYQVRSWQQNLPDLEQLIELNDATMGLLVIIVFAIVAMGISNTMSTVIFERFREFGTLAAIGTPPRGIVALVVLESFFLGLLAAILGSLAGALVCSLLARHGLDLSRFTSANQYFAAGHVLKAYLLPGDLLLAVAVTLATALLAGLYPAVKASRLEPVEALVHV